MRLDGTPRSDKAQASWEERTPFHESDSGWEYGSQGSTPQSGYDRPDQIFDLEYDEGDDDVLLDWEAFASQRRRLRCCGCGPALVLPEWWYRYSHRQRKVILGCAAGLVAAAALLVAAVVFLGLQLNFQGIFSPVVPAGSRGDSGGGGSGGGQGGSGGGGGGGSMGGSGNGGICAWGDYRLPNVVVPHSYNLTIEADLQPPRQVVGQVDIDLTLKQAAACIVLHATMDVVKVTLDGDDATWERSKEQEGQLLVVLGRERAAGGGLLSLQFRYTLQPTLSGFYLSTSTGPDGQEQSMALTDFEGTSARKAFPCFDEPQLKAKFHLTLTADRGLTALSNAPEEAVTEAGGGKLHHSFQETEPMSTYLFAMVVGNLSYVHWEVPPGINGSQNHTIRVFGVPGRPKVQLDAAAGYAAALLPFYERLLGAAYPWGPKLDLVAVPDYAGGAMENVGLITFRESYLLADPQTAGLQEHLEVASIISHEMSHMWFGDFVTPAFWGHLWLAEGPATYFENVGGEQALPGSAFLDRFYADSVTRFLDHDGTGEGSHPLATTIGVSSDDMVESFFDPVAYEKGASLLRLLRAYLSREDEAPPRLLRRSRQLMALPVGHGADVTGRGRVSSVDSSSSSGRGRRVNGSVGSLGDLSRRRVQQVVAGETGGGDGDVSDIVSDSTVPSGGDSSPGYPGDDLGQGPGDLGGDQRQNNRPMPVPQGPDQSVSSSDSSGSRNSASSGGSGSAATTFSSTDAAGVSSQGASVPGEEDSPPEVQGAASSGDGSEGDSGQEDGRRFFVGLRRYLQTHRYGNAVSGDLWEALAATSGEDVGKWMEAWTYQPGFPLVTVAFEDGDGNSTEGARLGASQAPFGPQELRLNCSGACVDPECSNQPGASRPWWVPLAYTTAASNGTGATPSRWLEMDSCKTGLQIVAEGSRLGEAWVKLNAGQLAPLRVQYPPLLWDRLAGAAAADHVQLPEVDLAGLLDDSWAIAAAGHGAIAPFLNLTRALGQRGGAEYSPWKVVSSHAAAVAHLLAAAPGQAACLPRWTSYVRTQVLAAGLQAALRGSSSFEVGAGDSTSLRLARPLLLQLAGHFGDSTIQQEAQRALQLPEGPPSDLAAVAAAVAIGSGSASAFNEALKQFLSDPSPEVRDRARGALAAAATPAQVQRLLTACLPGGGARPQDVSGLLGGLLSSGTAASPTAWSFMQQQAEQLHKKLGGTTRAAAEVAALVVQAAQQPACKVTAAQLDQLWQRNGGSNGAGLPRKPYLPTARAALKQHRRWLRTHAGPLCHWLREVE